jgi:hypothetical protein
VKLPRWKTIRTIWICRTLSLFVGGAAPVAAIEPPPVVIAGR